MTKLLEQSSNLFTTYNNLSELQSFIEQHTANEKKLMYFGAMATLNTLIKQTKNKEFEDVLLLTDKTDTEEIISNLYADFQSLKDGSWVPDQSSIGDSLSAVEDLMAVFGMEVPEDEE